MNLYIDLIFAVNLFMNGIIFALVASIAQQKPRPYRLLLGSGAAAGLYCLLLVFFRRWFHPLSAVGILMVGLLVTFGFVGLKKFGLLVIYAHVVAFLMGGMALALFHYVNVHHVRGVMGHLNLRFLVGAVVISYLLLQIGQWSLHRRRISRQILCQLTLMEGGQSLTLSALVDTGNSLREPTSGWPVIIVEKSALMQLVSPQQLMATAPDRVRMIPYQTIGNTGLLTGFVPQSLQLTLDDQPPQQLDQVMIGICQFKLSETHAYQGLIGPAAMAQPS